MTRRITRTTTDPGGASSTASATLVGDGSWRGDDGSTLTEADLRDAVGRVLPWTLTEFILEGVPVDELIPLLSFEPPGGDEIDWTDEDLPNAFRHWSDGSSDLPLECDPYPLVINGQPWVLHGDVVCPIDFGDLRLDDVWHTMSWNQLDSMTAGRDFSLSAGTLPGQGVVLMRHNDPDWSDRWDIRIWRLPAEATRVDAAFALIDQVFGHLDEIGWFGRDVFLAAMLLTVHGTFHGIDVDDWGMSEGGDDVGGETFEVRFGLAADDQDEVERRLRELRGERFVRWIVEGLPGHNTFATFPVDELLAEMRPVPDAPGMLTADNVYLARRITRINDGIAMPAFVLRPHPELSTWTGSRLLRAHGMDAQFGVVATSDEILPCRAMRCPWDDAERVAEADAAFLAWFVETSVTADDLFDTDARWQLPTEVNGYARDMLLMLVAEGITSGRWRSFCEHAVSDLVDLDLAIPADEDDENWDDGSPEQREHVLAVLAAYQSSKEAELE